MRTEIDLIDHPQLATITEIGRSELNAVEDRISRLLAEEPRAAAAQIRHVVDHMCRLTDWVALATQMQWEKTWGVNADTADAIELYRLTNMERADPQGAPELIDLHRRFSETI